MLPPISIFFLLTTLFTCLVASSLESIALRNVPHLKLAALLQNPYSGINISTLKRLNYPINSVDMFGKTLLMYAVEAGAEDLVVRLLAAGADITIRALDQEYLTNSLSPNWSTFTGNTASMLAKRKSIKLATLIENYELICRTFMLILEPMFHGDTNSELSVLHVELIHEIIKFFKDLLEKADN